jgi:hypothetical protein
MCLPNTNKMKSVLMQNSGLACLAAPLLLMTTTTSFAACQTSPFGFTFQNENVSASQEVDSQGCGIGFQHGKRGLFTESSIVSAPSHGTLRKLSDFSYAYYPTPGYKGADRYAIKICGSAPGNRYRPGGPGCTTVTYNANVK